MTPQADDDCILGPPWLMDAHKQLAHTNERPRLRAAKTAALWILHAIETETHPPTIEVDEKYDVVRLRWTSPDRNRRGLVIANDRRAALVFFNKKRQGPRGRSKFLYGKMPAPQLRELLSDVFQTP
jgi:hypothetical protein